MTSADHHEVHRLQTQELEIGVTEALQKSVSSQPCEPNLTLTDTLHDMYTTYLRYLKRRSTSSTNDQEF